MKVDKISPLGIVCLISLADGVRNRRTLSPDSDISNEPPEVQAACQKAWTPEVVAAYEAHKVAAV